MAIPKSVCKNFSNTFLKTKFLRTWRTRVPTFNWLLLCLWVTEMYPVSYIVKPSIKGTQCFYPCTLLVYNQTFGNLFCRNLSHVQIDVSYVNHALIWNVVCFHKICRSDKIITWTAPMFTGLYIETGLSDCSSPSMGNLPVFKLAIQLFIVIYNAHCLSGVVYLSLQVFPCHSPILQFFDFCNFG